MPRITLIVAAALAALALSAQAATAMPVRDAVATSGTTSPQDLRGADARDAAVEPQTGAATPSQDFRTADARDAGPGQAEPMPSVPTWPIDPEAIAPAPVETTPIGGDDTSPLLYVLPGIALSLLLATGVAYAMRTSGRARRARISA